MEENRKVPRPTIGDSAGQAVAAELRAEIGRQNLSFAALADRLEIGPARTAVDQRYVRRRLLGQIDLTLDDVQWFCVALDVPMSRILGVLGGDQ